MRQFSLPIGSIRDLAYSPDGRYLVVLGTGHLSFLDLATFAERFSLRVPEDSTVLRLGGFHVALGRVIHDLEPTWSALAEGKRQAPTSPFGGGLAPEGRGAFVSLSGDGRRGVIVYPVFADRTFGYWGGCKGARVEVWDLQTETLDQQFSLTGQEGPWNVNSLGDLPVSCDGRWAALLITEEVVVLDLERGGLKASFRHDAKVERVTFSPDGRTLAALAGSDLYTWDVVGHLSMRRIPIEGPCSVLAFHPNGQQVGLVHGSGIHFIHLPAGRETAVFDWGIRQPRGLAFSPDGSTAAVANRTNEVVLWDLD